MSKLKNGIFIHEITDKHIWLIYYHNGKAIYKQPMAQTFRDYLEPDYQKDIDDGQVANGFRPEFAFAAMRLSKAIDKELEMA